MAVLFHDQRVMLRCDLEWDQDQSHAWGWSWNATLRSLEGEPLSIDRAKRQKYLALGRGVRFSSDLFGRVGDSKGNRMGVEYEYPLSTVIQMCFCSSSRSLGSFSTHTRHIGLGEVCIYKTCQLTWPHLSECFCMFEETNLQCSPSSRVHQGLSEPGRYHPKVQRSS